MRKIRIFLLNTVVLTASSLLMRLCFMGFNAYLTNKIGQSAVGLLQLICNVYMVAVTVSSAGIRLSATRLVVDEVNKKNGNVGRIVRICIVYCLILSGISAIALFSFSGVISRVIIGTNDVALAFKVLAIGLPFEAVTAALCGYFSAVRRVPGMSVIIFLELAVRIAATVYLLLRMKNVNDHFACNAAAMGICFSEICSFFMFVILYLFGKKEETEKCTVNRARAFKSVVSIALPDGMSAVVRNLLVMAEHFLIPYGLKKRGSNISAALACYGVVTAMALPVVTFASVITSSAAGLIITEVADFSTSKRSDAVNLAASKSFRLTLIFSIFCSGALFYFADEICTLVYSSSDAAIFVKMLAPVIPVMYLDTVIDGFLKGAGLQLSSMKINIADAVLSVALVYLLVPRIGIYGYIITIFVTELFNFVLSAAKLSQVINIKLNIFTCVLKPIFCIAGAVCVSRLTVYFVKTGLSIPIICLIEMFISIIIYFATLNVMGCVSVKDIRSIKSLFCAKK